MAPVLAQTPFRHSDLHNFLCTCHRLSHRPMALPIPTDLLITRDNPRKGGRIKRRLSGGSRLSRLATFVVRSEEHTSELQSRPHLVCRLLLEKKKIITIIQY